MEIELTKDEVLYLEETLRYIRVTGQPVGFEKGQGLAQSILDKLEAIE